MFNILNTFSSRDVLTRPKIHYRTGPGHVNTSYVNSIFSALQEHFCCPIHYTNALHCHLYTMLRLALNVFNKPQCWMTVVFTAVAVPANAVTIATLNYSSFCSLRCVINRKVKSFKQTIVLSEQGAVLSKVTTKCSVQSAVFRP